MGDRMAHLPSLAAVAVAAVFTQAAVWLDGERPGLLFGVFTVFGSVLAAAMVRPVGLWVVVPAPPLLHAALVVAATAAAPGASAVLVVRAFPHVAVAVGAGLVVAAVRVGGKWWRSRSSSTGRAGAAG
ncbi:DUF6542 domain-containing protein [Saccharothrix syringae]|uniref:DUF6542 domain-containing protein n=1 Tax=Saccharothrix syringae TaxID=103733 RepID=A0A5Q0GTU1_SACSY|nr:DUF6542 domain-containing protein [Saccharothrix syringae]QFZ17331.1 hypothetical protein EKG83_07465 [Saccharothrix syringae]